MRSGDGIWLEGERELYLNMQKHLGTVGKAARDALQKGAMQIVNAAKENLRENESIATGQLRASGRVQRVEGDPDSVDAGFFSQNTSGGYAFFVEYGRRAGKMPPPDMLIQWFRKKLRLPVKEARARGWATAKSIAKKGTRPHPFFAPAVEKSKDAVSKAIAEAVREEL